LIGALELVGIVVLVVAILAGGFVAWYVWVAKHVANSPLKQMDKLARREALERAGQDRDRAERDEPRT